MLTTERKDVVAPVEPSGVTFALQNADGAQALGELRRLGAARPGSIGLADVLRRELGGQDRAVGEAADAVGVRADLLGDLEPAVPVAVVVTADLDRDP
jgi:hypothetical protein